MLKIGQYVRLKKEGTFTFRTWSMKEEGIMLCKNDLLKIRDIAYFDVCEVDECSEEGIHAVCECPSKGITDSTPYKQSPHILVELLELAIDQ